jgi:hypothetical protein
MAFDDALWCGRGISLSVRDPNGVVKSIQLAKPFARIGSDYRSDVVLEEGNVPSRAVYLHATEEGVYFRRLVPREQGDASSGWLGAGQSLRIGGYRVTASLAGQDQRGHPLPDLRRCRYPADESPRIRIQRVGLKGPAVEHTCRRPLTIVGRSRPSAIRLKRPLVSRCHCILFWDRRDLWVVDLLSANGTLLDGSPIDCQRVLPDQVLQLGEIQITYLGVGEGGLPGRAPDQSAGQWMAPATQPDEAVDQPPIESADELDLEEDRELAVPSPQPAAAVAGFDAVSLECAAEDESADLSSLALEMSLYACEEQSASGHTVTGAPRAALLDEVEIAQRESATQARAELTSRLQQLEQQRDELLRHVAAISSRLQELAGQEQTHALEADQWHNTVAAANQQIRELQTSLEAVRHESQLEADRLKKRCRRLKRQIVRSQRAPTPAEPAQELAADAPAVLAAMLASVESVGNSLEADPPPLLDCRAVIATEPEELSGDLQGDGWEYGEYGLIAQPLSLIKSQHVEEPRRIEERRWLQDEQGPPADEHDMAGLTAVVEDSAGYSIDPAIGRGLSIMRSESAHLASAWEDVDGASDTAEVTPPESVPPLRRRADRKSLTGTMELSLAPAGAETVDTAESGERGLVSRFIVDHIERESGDHGHSWLLLIIAGSVAALIMVAAAAWFWQGTLLPGS